MKEECSSIPSQCILGESFPTWQHSLRVSTPEPVQNEPVTTGKNRKGQWTVPSPSWEESYSERTPDGKEGNSGRWVQHVQRHGEGDAPVSTEKQRRPTRACALPTSASPQDLATLSMKHSSGHRPGRVGNSLHIQLLALPSMVSLLRKATIQHM